jgi:GxxExxY protein
LNKLDNSLLEEPTGVYSNLLYKDEVYSIISCCFEVHNELGKGFSEILYKDALSLEFGLNEIPFEREKQFDVQYKHFVLPRKYICDFIVDNKIILEVKSQTSLAEANSGQLLNYLAISKKRLGLLVNFGESSLKFKRVIL